MEVLSNFAVTLDGKIAPASRKFAKLGTDLDWQSMLELRGKVDAVVFGAANMRAYKEFGRAPSDVPKQPASVVVSSRLEGFSTSWPFFRKPEDRRILAVTSKLSPAIRKKFGAKSEILDLSPKKPLAPQLLKALAALGMKRVLIEGGGAIMWEFAKLNLIDEYRVTLVPKILGGADAPTMVEGEGFLPARLLQLKLVEARPVGDEVYLVYRKTS